MTTNRLLEAIGEIDDVVIRDAKAKQNTKPGKGVTASILAACLCLAILSALVMAVMHSSAPMGLGEEDAGKPFPDGTPGGYDPIPGGMASIDGEHSQQEVEVSEQIPAMQDGNEGSDSPIDYGSLKLAEGEWNEEALALAGTSMTDVAAFKEFMVTELLQEDGGMIIEGTVVNLYVKHYAFDVYHDKFGPKDVLHCFTDTVVYEIAVEKTWLGEDATGTCVLIEDMTYFSEPVLAVKKGGRYVLPIRECGETIGTLGHEYAGGNITRESRYCTVYPHHPQIEVTMDGSYLIPQDWTTLVERNARPVVMDMLEEGDYWKDKMYLVDANTFAEQMEVLIGAN